MNEQLQTKIQPERDNALAELSEVIDEARYKSLGDGRIRNPQSEKIRLKYHIESSSTQDLSGTDC